MNKFETQVDKFVIDTEAKMLAVMKNSIQDVIEEAQTPTTKGGKMRVKTGFLRSSGVAALNAIPRGAGKGSTDGNYTWDGDSVIKVLARMKAGDTFYFGWTANYARYREMYDGFLVSALRNWQGYVDKQVRRFRK